MSDYINIVGLEIYANIGVPAEERARRQKLLVNLSLRVKSVKDAAQADNVAQTVDYFTVSTEVKTLAAAKPRKLIETLAEDIATAVLRHERVKDVAVEIEKFILPDTRHVSVQIKRKADKKLRAKIAATALPAKSKAPHQLTEFRKPARRRPIRTVPKPQ